MDRADADSAKQVWKKTALLRDEGSVMSAPFISVLITTYNYGRFVEESIESVLSQDYPAERREVVVVDDGSMDDTAERVKKYKGRIRYFRKANGGQASALNLGFAEARGEIVCLLDADDYFLPGKLARVAEAFGRDPALGMFYHPFLEFDTETGERRISRFLLVSGSPFENPERFFGYGGPGTCVSFRRKFLDRLLPIPEEIRMLADGYLGSLIIFVAPIMATTDCLAVYRLHGGNCFYGEETEMPKEQLEKRMQLFRIKIRAMRQWLAANGLTEGQQSVRTILNSFGLYLDRGRFLLQPPGRVRYFRYLMKYIETCRSQMGWRLRLENYLCAVGALLFGYERREWVRGRVEHLGRRILGRSGPEPPD